MHLAFSTWFDIASHADDFKEARIFRPSPEEIRVPVKTPAWEVSFHIVGANLVLIKSLFTKIVQNSDYVEHGTGRIFDWLKNFS